MQQSSLFITWIQLASATGKYVKNISFDASKSRHMRKHLASIRGDRVSPILQGTERFNHGVGNFPGGLAYHFVHARKSVFAIGQSNEKMSVPLAQDRIDFSVSKPLALPHDFRALFDTGALRKLSTPFVAVIALSALLPRSGIPDSSALIYYRSRRQATCVYVILYQRFFCVGAPLIHRA